MSERLSKAISHLVDIESMSNFAVKMLGRGKDYDDLLTVILNWNSDNEKRKSIEFKDLKKELKISDSLICSQLEAIYNDLVRHNSLGIEFSIMKVEYIFCMRCNDKYERFVLNDLPCIPGIGDQIRIPFTANNMNRSTYYVEEIIHELSDTKQSILISVTPYPPNLYFKLFKDEAVLKEKISYEDYCYGTDREIKGKFGFKNF